MQKEHYLYLKVGDRVYHKKNVRWGEGIVEEERTSEVPGGFCYVRIIFQDNKTRIFDNNLRSNNCCYYSGIEKIDKQLSKQATGLKVLKQLDSSPGQGV